MRVSYQWHPSSNKPVADIRVVHICFVKADVPLWVYLMSRVTDNFEISIFGTRNMIHDGLDQCYVEVLAEVNGARAKVGLAEVHK